MDAKKFLETCGEWCKNNKKVIIGGVIFVFGLFLIFESKYILINAILLILGLVCIYFGLHLMNLKKITDIIDNLLKKLKSIILDHKH